jgi:hypothetical protein
MSRAVNFGIFSLVCLVMFSVMIARNYGYVSDRAQWWSAVVGFCWAGGHIMAEVWLSGQRVESPTGERKGFDVIVRKKDDNEK